MIRARTIISFVLVAGAGVGLVLASMSIVRSNTPAQAATTEVAAIPAQPTTIGALGTVEPPGGAIDIAPPSSGVVAEVAVEPGQKVKAGDLLFRLDDRLARARVAELTQSVASAEAALADAKGSLPGLRAQVDAAQAALSEAEVQRADAAAELATAEQLSSGSTTVSRREVERRRSTLDGKIAAVDEARARLLQAQAEVARLDPAQSGSRLLPLQSAVESARAALATAQTQLDLLSVTSPVDAIVLETNARPGQYATAGSAEPLVSLGAAGELHVRAQVDEADLPLLSSGAQAWGVLKGDTATRIPLTFVRREPLLKPKSTLAGGTTERIDTRVIEVVFSAADPSLLPGQLINVLIDVGQKAS